MLEWVILRLTEVMAKRCLAGHIALANEAVAQGILLFRY